MDGDLVKYLFDDGVFISERLKFNNHLGVEEEDECPRFPKFEALIKSVLADYERVFIKLNWFAPKDCSNWAFDLAFDNLHDVFMALKTSGILMDMIGDYSEWCG